MIQCCDGGDQVILTELSFSITTDNPIGEPSTEVELLNVVQNETTNFSHSMYPFEQID